VFYLDLRVPSLWVIPYSQRQVLPTRTKKRAPPHEELRSQTADSPSPQKATKVILAPESPETTIKEP